MMNQLRVTVTGQTPFDLAWSQDERVIAAAVGDTLTFAYPQSTASAPTVAVTRAPGGSSATPSGAAITLDVPGLFELTAKDGGRPAERVRVACFPVAALSDFRITQPKRQVLPTTTVADPSPRNEVAVRDILRRYALEQVRAGKDLSTLDGLTTPSPLPAGQVWQ